MKKILQHFIKNLVQPRNRIETDSTEITKRPQKTWEANLRKYDLFFGNDLRMSHVWLQWWRQWYDLTISATLELENFAKLNVCSSVSGYVNLQDVSLWAILSFGLICVKFWLEFLVNELWFKHSSRMILVEAIKPGDNSNMQAYHKYITLGGVENWNPSLVRLCPLQQ